MRGEKKRKKKGKISRIVYIFGFIVQPKIERRMIKEMIFFWTEGSKKFEEIIFFWAEGCRHVY
jgi:hypothetical protein